MSRRSNKQRALRVVRRPGPELAHTPQSDLTERVVGEIVALDRLHRLTFALEVGALLFDEVFGGCASLVSDRSAAAPAFRQVAVDPRLKELGLGRSTLHNYVRLHVQLSRANGPLRSALLELSVSKQVRLLRVHDRESKRQLAVRAVAEGWTVRELEAAVAELVASDRALAGHEVPGRKPLPPAVVRAREVMRAADRLTEVIGSLDSVPHLERARLRERLRLILDEVAEVEAACGRPSGGRDER